jgi:hypothetical protein
LPSAPKFAAGWSIGKPDLIFKMQQPFNVPADGTVPYSYVTIPTNLKEDVWIRGVELKPTDRRVVHHIISTLVEGNGKPPDPGAQADARSESQGARWRSRWSGARPLVQPLRGWRRAKIPAGADIVLRCTTRPSAAAITDQTENLASSSPRNRRQSCAPKAAGRFRT